MKLLNFFLSKVITQNVCVITPGVGLSMRCKQWKNTHYVVAFVLLCTAKIKYKSNQVTHIRTCKQSRQTRSFAQVILVLSGCTTFVYGRALRALGSFISQALESSKHDLGHLLSPLWPFLLLLMTSTLTAYLTPYATLVHQGTKYPR